MKEEPEGWLEIAILKEMEASAGARGTGIGKRSPQSLCQKIYEGKAVIALGEGGEWRVCFQQRVDRQSGGKDIQYHDWMSGASNRVWSTSGWYACRIDNLLFILGWVPPEDQREMLRFGD